MDAAERLMAAEAMVKEWEGRCAVCGTRLVAYYQDFAKVGHPLCDTCMRRWRRGARAPTTRAML